MSPVSGIIISKTLYWYNMMDLKSWCFSALNWHIFRNFYEEVFYWKIAVQFL